MLSDDTKSFKAEHGHIETSSGSDADAALAELDTIEDTATGSFVWLICLAASIGGLLFGYDTGVISGVLVVLGEDLGHELSNPEKELITSLTSGGAFIGAALSGFLADRFGRKPMISAGCVLFTLGALIQAVSWGVPQMSVGRFVIGIGVGMASMVVPIYIAEVAPAHKRGQLIVIDAMCITGGQVISYAIGAAFTNVAHGWRYMVGLGGVPSIILLMLLPFCPETPRHLVFHGKKEEAKRVLGKIYPNGTDEQIQNKVALIEHGVEKAREATEGKSLAWKVKQLYTVPQNFRALVVSCGLMAIQQLCGFNTLMYYSATLFAMVGFDNPVAVGLVIAGTNFIFTGVALRIIDRLGRRRTLLYTMWGMALGLVIVAIAFYWIPVTGDLELVEGKQQKWPGIVVLVALVLYVAFYATGLGNVPWQGTELHSMEVRALGTMMLSCTCWGCNIIVSATFLSMMKSMTPSGAFGFYAGICFFGWIAVIFCYPEVAGMTLESIGEVFSHGFGVKYAEQLRKERKLDEREKRAAAAVAGN